MTDDNDEIEALEAQIDKLETASRNSDGDGWSEALERTKKNLERVKDGDTSTETSEDTSNDYVDDDMAELEKEYEHAKRGGESRTSSGEVWSRLADRKREELIEAKMDALENMAKEHDAMSPRNRIEEKEQEALYSDFEALKGEIESLREDK